MFCCKWKDNLKDRLFFQYQDFLSKSSLFKIWPSFSTNKKKKKHEQTLVISILLEWVWENDIILWVLNTWADSELIMTIPWRKIKLSTQKRGSHQLSLIITSSTNTEIWVWAFPIPHSISPSYILSCTKLSIHNQKQKCPYWSWSLGYYDPSLNQYTRVKKDIH